MKSADERSVKPCRVVHYKTIYHSAASKKKKKIFASKIRSCPIKTDLVGKTIGMNYYQAGD